MVKDRVRAVRCDYRATDQEIYAALRRATDPLDRAWHRLEHADRIVIKFNMLGPSKQVHRFEGRRQELVDEAIARAVLRLLGDRTRAEIIVTDTDPSPDFLMGDSFNYAHILREFDVAFVDSNIPPFKTYEVPGGGSMFNRYTLSGYLDGAEVVSVAKMKSHKSTGVTLCVKNLFGLPPITRPFGRHRSYYHHLVRLPHVLTDLALITNPALNIIEALTGQSGSEWGGEGRICDTLIAGDHPISTDVCGAWLMGHDPASDWPTPPFRRDRNHLLIAAQRGFGTVDLGAMDFKSEVERPLSDFDSTQTDPEEVVESWRKTTCEQALFYRENRDRLVAWYRDEFILLQQDGVIWHGDDLTTLASRRLISGPNVEQGIWIKLVDPEEYEGEHFEVYQRELQRRRDAGTFE